MPHVASVGGCELPAAVEGWKWRVGVGDMAGGDAVSITVKVTDKLTGL